MAEGVAVVMVAAAEMAEEDVAAGVVEKPATKVKKPTAAEVVAAKGTLGAYDLGSHDCNTPRSPPNKDSNGISCTEGIKKPESFPLSASGN